MNWARGESFPANDGLFVFRADRGYLAHLIRIEAEGYEVAVSREIKSTEGDVLIDFELKRGTNIAAKVTTPDGAPAAGARIAPGDRRVADQHQERRHRRWIDLQRPGRNRRRRPLRVPGADHRFPACDHPSGGFPPHRVDARMGPVEAHQTGAVVAGRRRLPDRSEAGRARPADDQRRGARTHMDQTYRTSSPPTIQPPGRAGFTPSTACSPAAAISAAG